MRAITISSADVSLVKLALQLTKAISKSIGNRIVIGKTFPTTVVEPKAICHDTE